MAIRVSHRLNIREARMSLMSLIRRISRKRRTILSLASASPTTIERMSKGRMEMRSRKNHVQR